tara:strand:+ start:291 stop:500 length:210 start_codon:yes stop_codon:yes gene_type:complete
MARFILDVANLSEKQIDSVMNELINNTPIVSDGISTIVCVDNTNDNQFYDDCKKNNLSEKHINNFNQNN